MIFLIWSASVLRIVTNTGLSFDLSVHFALVRLFGEECIYNPVLQILTASL